MKSVRACSKTPAVSLAFRHIYGATTPAARLIDRAGGVGLVDSATAQSGRLIDRAASLSARLVDRAAAFSKRLIDRTSPLSPGLVDRTACFLWLVNCAPTLPMRLVDRASPALRLVNRTAALPSGLIDRTAAGSCRLVYGASHMSHAPSRDSVK